MKTLKITTDNKISIIDVDLDDYRALQQEIGGYVETVHTQIMYDYFRAPVLMLVDEEGLIKNLPANAVASHFYGCQNHGHIIAGALMVSISLKLRRITAQQNLRWEHLNRWRLTMTL